MLMPYQVFCPHCPMVFADRVESTVLTAILDHVEQHEYHGTKVSHAQFISNPELGISSLIARIDEPTFNLYNMAKSGRLPEYWEWCQNPSKVTEYLEQIPESL